MDIENMFLIKKWGNNGVSHFCYVGMNIKDEDNKNKFITLVTDSSFLGDVVEEIESPLISNFNITKDNKLEVQVDSTVELDNSEGKNLENGIVSEIFMATTAFDLLIELVKLNVDLLVSIPKRKIGATSLFDDTDDEKEEAIRVSIRNIKAGNTPNVNLYAPHDGHMNVLHLGTFDSGEMKWETLIVIIKKEDFTKLEKNKYFNMCVVDKTIFDDEEIAVSLDLNILSQEVSYNYIQYFAPIMSMNYQAYAITSVVSDAVKINNYINKRLRGEVINTPNYIYHSDSQEHIKSCVVKFKPYDKGNMLKISDLEMIQDKQLMGFVNSYINKDSNTYFESVFRDTLQTLINGEELIMKDPEFEQLKWMLTIARDRYSAFSNKIFISGTHNLLLGTLSFKYE